MHLYNYFVLLTLISLCFSKDTIPTFVIDYDMVMHQLHIESNPFAKTSMSKLAEIVEAAVIRGSIIIFFIEGQLSTEDLSLKDAEGTPFRNLHNELLNYKVKYIPNAVNPVKLFTHLLEPTEFNVFVLKSDENFQPIAATRFFYVFFKDDDNESRIAALRRHDKIIKYVYEGTRNIASGAVIGFYTGKVNPAVLKHDYTPKNVFISKDRSDITIASHGALIRFKGLLEQRGPSGRRHSAWAFETPRILRGSGNKDTTTTQVAVGKYFLKFVCKLTRDNWILESIKLTEGNKKIGALQQIQAKVPYGRSYFCDEPLHFFNDKDKSSFIVVEYQVQPFKKGKTSGGSVRSDHPDYEFTDSRRRQDNNTNTAVDGKAIKPFTGFHKAVMCNSYFNIGILTGLWLSGLFLMVLIVAIYCLYHIEPNDRFEDPHGKIFYTAAFE